MLMMENKTGNTTHNNTSCGSINEGMNPNEVPFTVQTPKPAVLGDHEDVCDSSNLGRWAPDEEKANVGV